MTDDLYSGDLSGFSMKDLFCMEARGQARQLTESLLQLERGAADPATLELLMRAAHSVKGAAAIVGSQHVVQLAHAMENLFVAAQEQRLLLGGADIDALLAAVDLLQLLAELAEDGPDAAARAGLDARIAATLHALDAVGARAHAAPLASSARAAPPERAADPAPKPAPGAAGDGDGADLLALANQAKLVSLQVQPWIDSLQRQRRQQHSAMAALESLHEAIVAGRHADLLEPLATLRERAAPLGRALRRTIQEAEQFERRSTRIAQRLVDGTLALSMCAFRDGVHGLPRMVRDLARGLGKDVRLVIEGGAVLVDRAVLARMESPLNQLLRNALDHGIETPEERIAAGKPAGGTIRLEARHRGGMLLLEVADDGRGVDPERIRRAAVARRLAPGALAQDLSQAELMELLFLPGLSLKEEANEMSGRGVGLDVVHDAVRALGGSLVAESGVGRGFRTTITLPLTQSIVRALVVEVAGDAYALPIARVGRVLRVPAAQLRTLSGRQYAALEDGEHVSLVAAARVLELGAAAAGSELPVVVIGAGRERYGLVVDAVRGEQALTVQALEPVFGKLQDVAAGALLDDGMPVLILDVPDLLHSIARLLDAGALLDVSAAHAAQADGTQGGQHAGRVLVVDDSLTVRELQRKILATRGYQVDVALDGIDGWNRLRGADYDLVITDVDMPRLDGIGLVQRIRADARLARLPVLIVSYKDRPDDRARGLAAGADDYLAKGTFHDASLLDAVQALVGKARAKGRS